MNITGENLLAATPNAVSTLVSLIDKGSKSLRVLVGQFLAMITSPDQFRLIMLSELAKTSNINYLNLVDIVNDTWSMEAYCQWHSYYRYFDEKPDWATTNFIVLFMKASVLKLVRSIMQKNSENAEMEELYLTKFFDSIDMNFFALEQLITTKKSPQLMFMRILRLINVDSMPNPSNNLVDAVSKCFSYFYDLLFCDSGTYTSDFAVKYHLELADIVFSKCLQWRKTIPDFLPVQTSQLDDDCKQHFAFAIEQFYLEKDKAAYQPSHSFQVAVQNYAVYLRLTDMSQTKLYDAQSLFKYILPIFLSSTFYPPFPHKVALLAICTRICSLLYFSEEPTTILKESVLDCLQRAGSKLLSICFEVIKPHLSSRDMSTFEVLEVSTGGFTFSIKCKDNFLGL